MSRLRREDLGVTHLVLSNPPYREETIRVGDHLRPLLEKTPTTA